MQFYLVKLNFLINCLLFTFSTLSFCQQANDTLKVLNQRFQAFEYKNTISTADSLLRFSDSLSNDLQLEINRIKGISHFSLLQDELARQSFLNILRVDSTYTLDTATTSPKIISFFNQVKNAYMTEVQQVRKSPQQTDTVYITKIVDNPNTSLNTKNAMLRSLVLPGWGHLYSGYSTKGIILTSLSTITLLSSLYFIFDTNNKEDEYMNEEDVNEIESKYDKYNRSYKIRNSSLIAFGVVWLYSQLDLLIFSDTQTLSENSDPDLEVISNGYSLEFRLNF